MECAIPARSLKPFSKAITCMAKIGEEITIEASKSKLTLSTLDSARTAFVKCLILPGFSERYEVTSALCAEGGDRNSLKCRILLKSLLHIFKTKQIEKTVEKTVVAIGEVECRVTFQHFCKHGITKTHKVIYEDCERLMNANYSKETAANRITLPSKFITDFLGGFSSGLEEITWIVDHKGLKIQSFSENAASNNLQRLETKFIFGGVEFDNFQVTEKAQMTFSFKEFKAILALADAFGQQVEVYFNGERGNPILFNVSCPDVLEMDFVLATFNPKLHDDDTNSEASHSQASSRKSAVSSAQKPGITTGRREATRRSAREGDDEEGGAAQGEGGFPATPSPAPQRPQQQQQQARSARPSSSSRAKRSAADDDGMEVDGDGAGQQHQQDDDYQDDGGYQHHPSHDHPHHHHHPQHQPESEEKDGSSAQGDMDVDSIPLRQPKRTHAGGNMRGASPTTTTATSRASPHVHPQRYDGGNQGHHHDRSLPPSQGDGGHDMMVAEDLDPADHHHRPQRSSHSAGGGGGSSSRSSAAAAQERRILENGVASPRTVVGIVPRQSAQPQHQPSTSPQPAPAAQQQQQQQQVQFSSRAPQSDPARPASAHGQVHPDPARRATPPQHASSHPAHPTPPQAAPLLPAGHHHHYYQHDGRRGSGSDGGSPSHIQFPFHSPDSVDPRHGTASTSSHHSHRQQQQQQFQPPEAPQYHQQPMQQQVPFQGQFGRIPLIGTPSATTSRRTPPSFTGLPAAPASHGSTSHSRPSMRSSGGDSDRIIPTARMGHSDEEEDEAEDLEDLPDFVEGTPPPSKAKFKTLF